MRFYYGKTGQIKKTFNVIFSLEFKNLSKYVTTFFSKGSMICMINTNADKYDGFLSFHGRSSRNRACAWSYPALS